MLVIFILIILIQLSYSDIIDFDVIQHFWPSSFKNWSYDFSLSFFKGAILLVFQHVIWSFL